MSQDSFAHCEALVRRADYDRYLSVLLAPAEARSHLFALYAFNCEAARTAESVSQPLIGQIRLQWWRDAIEEIYAGGLRRHEVVRVLAKTVGARELPRELFHALLDARESDLDETPFVTWADFEAYADATSGNLMRMAARIIGAGHTIDEAAREAGIAYALAGLLRALPFHAARRRLMLPLEALRAVSLSQEQVFSGVMDEKISALIRLAVERAKEHLGKIPRVKRALLPAILPAALAPLYLRKVTQRRFDPFRDSAGVSIHRRQFAMLRALIRGRL